MGKIRTRYGRGTGKLHPVDVHVGARLRQRRALLGMSQTKLGDAIGVTFQQMQKYERRTNRIASSRLFVLSRVHDVPVEYFFDDMPPAVAAGSPVQARGMRKELSSYERDPMATRETLELVRAYWRISNPQVRQRLREMTKAAGAAES